MCKRLDEFYHTWGKVWKQTVREQRDREREREREREIEQKGKVKI